eukprot:Skav208152  [mRNA]  locus=scaffold2891:38367:38606:- [translate_table: standard]
MTAHQINTGTVRPQTTRKVQNAQQAAGCTRFSSSVRWWSSKSVIKQQAPIVTMTATVKGSPAARVEVQTPEMMQEIRKM